MLSAAAEETAAAAAADSLSAACRRALCADGLLMRTERNADPRDGAAERDETSLREKSKRAGTEVEGGGGLAHSTNSGTNSCGIGGDQKGDELSLLTDLEPYAQEIFIHLRSCINTLLAI